MKTKKVGKRISSYMVDLLGTKPFELIVFKWYIKILAESHDFSAERTQRTTD